MLIGPAALLLALCAQDPAPAQPPVGSGASGGASAAPVASPGSTGAAGAAAEIPPAARDLFGRLCAHLQPDAAVAARPKSFAIQVELVTREGVQRNEDTAELRFLAPEFVRVRMRSGREQGKGPSGYWLREKDEVVPLVGRDYDADRDQIDEIAMLARNFAALLRPRELAIAGLAIADGPGARLPASVLPPAVPLQWLEIASSDFRLPWPRAKAGVMAVDPKLPHRARIGIEPESGRPHFAIVFPPVGDTNEPALLVLRDAKLVDGTQLPHTVLVFQREPGERAQASANARAGGIDFAPAAPTFAKSAHLELYLLGGSRLGLPLAPTDFAPTTESRR